jgi:D-glycero-alpha-D-manno-heptose-7-phosphate kinase
MEFSLDLNTILPLRLDDNKLIQFQEWCYLVDSNISHDSSKIHEKIKKQQDYKEKYSLLVKQSYVLRDLLMRGDIEGFADAINKVLEIKKTLNDDVSSKELDNMYEDLIQAGASGGKILGAGGGGYFLMLVDPLKRSSFLSSEKLKKYKIENVHFDTKGAFSW